jgi:hypothetical protein
VPNVAESGLENHEQFDDISIHPLVEHQLMIGADAMIGQLDELIDRYDVLCARSEFEDLSDLPDQSRVLAVQFQAAIDRMTTPQSTYRLDADTYRSELTHIRVVQLSGTVKALRDDLHRDWVSHVSELVHADTFTDLLEMASELLEKGYKDAAAVMAGSALELHLKSLSSKNGVALRAANGAPVKADRLNAELKKATVYGLLQQKNVTVWLNIRNDAAHANYSEYDSKDVEQLLAGLEHFMATYPA